MYNSNYEVNILVDGKPQKIHYHDNKYYLEARENYEYSIKIKNNSYEDILAITSIDGLDSMSGKTASDNSGGYIIAARSSFEIKGFRKDLNTVGAFKFCKKNNSYAKSKRSGAEKNCGVIGIRLFNKKIEQATVVIKEKEYIPYPIYPTPIYPAYPSFPYRYWYYGDTTCDSAIGSCGGTSSSINNCNITYSNSCSNDSLQNRKTSFSLGSTWGEKKDSSVIESSFNRGILVFSQDIYYSTRQDLINMGVPIIKQPKISYPESFSGKFAEPPNNWRG